MTLQEFFELLAANPAYILFFFFMLPFTAFLAGWLGKDEGHISPWKYLYSVLVYLACIPGIFAVTLNIYLFLFEKQPIFQTDIYTQLLPIVAMVGTLWIITKNVSLDSIPGFEKLSSLVLIMFSVLAMMWFFDRTRIWMVSFVRFEIVLLIFLALIITIRVGMKRIFS
ncbi:MAG: hypothetical protein AAF798_00315 [Bacteroidota bacterium]